MSACTLGYSALEVPARWPRVRITWICSFRKLDASSRYGSAGCRGFYPINSLRNAAVQHAASELVVLLDVDFMPSARLCEILFVDFPCRRAQVLRSLCVSNGAPHCLVVPNFEATEFSESSFQQLLTSKQGLVAAWRAGRVRGISARRPLPSVRQL